MSAPGRILLRQRLLDEIEGYLARTGMAQTRFGELAVGDYTLVTGLRSDRPILGPKRAAKVRAFMRSCPDGEPS
jgi:hypothetical protein